MQEFFCYSDEASGHQACMNEHLHRNERPGVKFNDMDLIGIPVRITVGKKVEENNVEFKLRNSDEVEIVSIDGVIEKIKGLENV